MRCSIVLTMGFLVAAAGCSEAGSEGGSTTGFPSDSTTATTGTAPGGTTGSTATTSGGGASTTTGSTATTSGGTSTTTGSTATTSGGTSTTSGANGDGGMGDSGSGPVSGAGDCGPETTVSAADLGNPDNLGPWTPMHVENTGPNGSSWIFYPEELGKDGLKHPVFQWGPGAGTDPSWYVDHLNLLASQGFVIISQASTQSGREALTWILEQNESQGSMWYQKLDPDRVGRGGHSMGALQSMSEADDERLKLYVLVCGGAGGNGGASDIDDPVIFLGGEGLGDTQNFEPDYGEVTGPAIFIRHGDTDHIYCARDNLGPWVAFMRWQFCGEEKWKQEFESGGTYCMGEWGACETKNL